MSRRQFVVSAWLLLCVAQGAFADDAALWREYGLADTQTIKIGKHSATAYRLKDPTDALAAWQWQRGANDRACAVSTFCAQNAKRTLINEQNYLLSVDGPPPIAKQLEAALAALPNKRDTSLPAILTFLPRNGLVPNTSRYILGPDSLRAFAPELNSVNPGFSEGAEAQVADYDVKGRVKLAVFYYASPEMARTHAQEFKSIPNLHIKRSAVLVALVLPGATDAQADNLLSRVEYEARITWNDEPPPSPIKPLYQLLRSIIEVSILFSILGTVGGLIYGGMRLYRRKFGTLEADESMTTLHLTRD